MFKEDPSIAKAIRSSNTQIGTANKGETIGSTQVGELDLQTKGGYSLPGLKSVVFSKNLRDNLVSVGKICDGGYTVVFNSCGTKIFPNKGFKTEGKEIHGEGRDKKTGMFPLTLFPANSLTALGGAKAFQVKGDLDDLVVTARAVLAKTRCGGRTAQEPDLELPKRASDQAIATLARVYVREDLDEANRWHARCGHISMKYLKRLGLKALQGKKLPETFRCESCIKGKIHRQPHKDLHLQKKADFKPGEAISTDHMGPYARSHGGMRYGQIFKDAASSFRWCYTMAKKTGSDKAITETLIDAKARSGRSVRFLKTDGDGVFTSGNFEEIRTKHGFIHERSAPEDHDGNAEIEREIRTTFEGVATALEAAGAPAYFWADAMHHFVFTKNVLPLVPVVCEGKTEYKSARCILDPGARPFNLDYLVPFGTLCTCYVPESRREGGKAPSQKKSFKGAILGYVLDMNAYRVWDLEKRKKRDISFSFAFIHEGFFPFQNKVDWPPETEGEPIRFFPSREAILDAKEWETFDFDVRKKRP
jgi:hypothetical protein